MRIITNPDKNYVDKIRKALRNNNDYCPRSSIKDESTKCMCQEFRNMIDNKEIGECNCGLYKIVEND